MAEEPLHLLCDMVAGGSQAAATQGADEVNEREEGDVPTAGSSPRRSPRLLPQALLSPRVPALRSGSFAAHLLLQDPFREATASAPCFQPVPQQQPQPQAHALAQNVPAGFTGLLSARGGRLAEPSPASLARAKRLFADLDAEPAVLDEKESEVDLKRRPASAPAQAGHPHAAAAADPTSAAPGLEFGGLTSARGTRLAASSPESFERAKRLFADLDADLPLPLPALPRAAVPPPPSRLEASCSPASSSSSAPSASPFPGPASVSTSFPLPSPSPSPLPSPPSSPSPPGFVAPPLAPPSTPSRVLPRRGLKRGRFAYPPSSPAPAPSAATDVHSVPGSTGREGGGPVRTVPQGRSFSPVSAPPSTALRVSRPMPGFQSPRQQDPPPPVPTQPDPRCEEGNMADGPEALCDLEAWRMQRRGRTLRQLAGPDGRLRPVSAAEAQAAGVAAELIGMDLARAADFRFRVDDRCPRELREACGADGVGGWEAMREALRRLGARQLDSPLGAAWVRAQYAQLVWKMAATERMFPHRFARSYLTPTRLLLHLRYRYEREYLRAHRPALRKICERDEVSQPPCPPVSSCVCRVVSCRVALRCVALRGGICLTRVRRARGASWCSR